MFTSFFKVAFRVFIRKRVYTLINIFGLGVGLTFSIIIFLYAHKEISYDRFHENAHRIYRVTVKGKMAENSLNFAITSAPLAGTMIREIPGLEKTVRVARFGAWLIRYGDVRYNEDNVIFADPEFFRLFSFPLISGNPEEVLRNPNSIVLSQQAAQRYFGTEEPVGKMLRIENDSTYYRVTGVMKDIPENSHMHFDMVGTLKTFEKTLHLDSWVAHFMYTYCLIRDGASVHDVDKGLQEIAAKHVIPDYKKMLAIDEGEPIPNGNYYQFVLQPLLSIHLKSTYTHEFEPVGKILYIYLFGALACVILILSCMNFINLVTAQAINRSREVGIRKIAGSEKKSLVRQFLVESSLLAFLAMTLALLFTELALPAFSKYIGLSLSLGQLLNSSGIILLILLLLIIGILSGLYPAYHLSSFNPLLVLYNRSNPVPVREGLRKALVVFQLFLAVGALTMTLIISYQFYFLVHKERGYDTKNLVVIRRPDALTNRLEEYKQIIGKHPGVLSVTNTTSAMGGTYPRYPYYPEGGATTKNYSASTLLVSYGFDSTYRIRMAEGRFFNRANPNDSAACVINETAVKQMQLENPIGKTLIELTSKPGKTYAYKIIGVTKDFHFETLENQIRPLIMILMPGNREGYLAVRLTPANQDSTIAYLNTVWNQFTNAYPFVYYSLEKDKHDHYLPVRKTARVFSLLSVVTIFVACLGLFGLTTFSYSRRQRDIGIQKVMGASNLSIMVNSMVRITSMVLISSLAAWTGVFFLAREWFKSYAYHINMSFAFFAAATCIILFFALATIYYHNNMATRVNPGQALKYE